MITCMDTVTEGRILFQGEEIGDRKAFQITEMGISRTFQNIRLFHDLTVLQNVMVGRHCRTQDGP